ncbi:cation transporter [Sinirhodobacter populi]|uniref:Cation transporter n=1 Tax=Paenirhodobacter populi TaxID=2306993 RepID=A0A443K4C8_9RHOB|nr:cation transporter [Sinirhodobacter populi]RWR27553.1 cation transporter [Sinirhodobacter populi]
MTDEELLAGLAACRIAHHIPGRLRVKLGATSSQAMPGLAEAAALLVRLRAIQGVKAVTVNKLARSSTVEYDPAILAPEGWEDVMQGRQTGAAEELLARFGKTR